MDPLCQRVPKDSYLVAAIAPCTVCLTCSFDAIGAKIGRRSDKSFGLAGTSIYVASERPSRGIPEHRFIVVRSPIKITSD